MGKTKKYQEKINESLMELFSHKISKAKDRIDIINLTNRFTRQKSEINEILNNLSEGDIPRPEVALDKEGAMLNFCIKQPKGLQESIDEMEKFVKDQLSFQALFKSERPKIERLIKLGVLGSDDTRSHNVGASDYSKHLIQPWAIMQDHDLDYWDADIVKRVLRDKKGESKKLDYEKIIHICQEKIRQIG